jgi:hypothetical protein
LKYLVLISLLISGCVIYPTKNIAEPSYRINFTNSGVTDVKVSSSLEATKGTCEYGRTLNKIDDYKFKSNPEYSWVKVKFLVPVDGVKPINVCVTDSENNKLYWNGDMFISGNIVPSIFELSCTIQNTKLLCNEVNT